MSKKNFKDSTSHLDRFFSDQGETPEAHDTQEEQRAPETPPISPSSKYYRINLKLKAEYREYLERVSWESHQSITQYINNLIEDDMVAKDIRDT